MTCEVRKYRIVSQKKKTFMIYTYDEEYLSYLNSIYYNIIGYILIPITNVIYQRSASLSFYHPVNGYLFIKSFN